MISDIPAPSAVAVRCDGQTLDWPAGANRLTIGRAEKAEIAVAWRDQTFTRSLDLPLNRRYFLL